jgi:hypothetical protein
MKNYKVRVIKTRVDIFVIGELTVHENHYLIIDDEDLSHRYPIAEVIIDELKEK